MATPTATLTADKPKYAPGDKVTLRYVATDPDSKVLNGTGQVTDAAGNPANCTIVITIEDPLTYKAPAIPGMTFTQSPTDPAVWTGTAPGA